NCVLQQDWICPFPNQRCQYTVICGDGKLGGQEVCDDANTKPDDGCSADCKTVEAGWDCTVPGIACKAKQCGDGLKRRLEGCDDGNVSDFDGCTHDCKKERGYDCLPKDVAVDLSHVPTIFRDFRPYDDPLHPHPDFERFSSHLEPYIVQASLAGDGEPMHVP